MKLVIAPDSFKESLSAAEVAAASGLHRVPADRRDAPTAPAS